MRGRSISMLLLLSPTLLGASDPIRLAPSSQWSLNYGDNSCQLTRLFGTGEDLTTLSFEQASPKSALTLVVIGMPLSGHLESPEIRTRFLPAHSDSFYGQAMFATSRQKPAVFWSSISFEPPSTSTEEARAEMAGRLRAAKLGQRPQARDLQKELDRRLTRERYAEAATSIEVAVQKKHPVIFETGSLGVPIRMLADCARAQLKSWGVDPKLEDKIVRPAWAAHQEQWFSSKDYPKSALEKYAESLVQTRLLIDAAGKVSGCTSLSQFPNSDFGKTVCDIYRTRGRFEPAELADGTKVPSYVVVTTSFVMPPALHF